MQVGIGDLRPFKLRQCPCAIPFLPEQPPQFIVQDGFLVAPIACGQTLDERGAGQLPLSRLSVEHGEIGSDPSVLGRGIERLLHQGTRLLVLPQPRFYPCQLIAHLRLLGHKL